MIDCSLDCSKNALFFQYISQFLTLTLSYLVNRAAILSHNRRQNKIKQPPGRMCDKFPDFIIHEKNRDLLTKTFCPVVLD